MTVDKHCEISDLPAAFCAHCRGHRLPEEIELHDQPDAEHSGSRWFQAEFPGKCVCGDSFGPGTTIRYEGNSIRTQDCEEG